jgi:hypothetical protein
MSHHPVSIVVAVFLLLAGLYNIGAGVAHFGKAELVSGTTSALASMGESMAGVNQGNAFAKASGSQLRSASQDVRAMGARSSLPMYLVSIGIVLAAAVQLVAGVGVFTRSVWAPKVLMFAGVAGVLVEIQDVFEDGLGAGQLVFLAIAAGAIYLSLQIKGAAGPSQRPASK